MHPIGTVPTDKMHPVGTVPMDKMHPVGELQFNSASLAAENIPQEKGKPSKLEHSKNSQQKKFQSFTWEFFRNRGGGGQEFSPISQVHKKGGQKGRKTLIRPYIF